MRSSRIERKLPDMYLRLYGNGSVHVRAVCLTSSPAWQINVNACHQCCGFVNILNYVYLMNLKYFMWVFILISHAINALSVSQEPFFNSSIYQYRYRTAKTEIWNKYSHLNRIAWHRSQFPHSCVCERFINSHDWSAHSAAGNYVDRSWEYINP
jgi:hypothetical protein